MLVINVSLDDFVICVCDLIRPAFRGMLPKISQNLLCHETILPASELIQ